MFQLRSRTTVQPLPLAVIEPAPSRFQNGVNIAKRYVLPAGVVALQFASAQTGSGEISAADFTSVATKVLTYLGYAIAAGLTVVVAVVAAQAGWRFFSKFIK